MSYDKPNDQPPVYTQQPGHGPQYPQGGPQYPSGTTVVVQQQPLNMEREFSSDLCSCFDDCESCILVYFCGHCYLACSMYPRYHENCCVPCLYPGALALLRSYHRGRHNIQGTLMNDCCVSTFCWSCTACQLKRDMDFTEQQKGFL